MKDHVLFLLCATLSWACHAQADLSTYPRTNSTDSLGNKQGFWVEHYDNGAVESVICYKDNLLDGVSMWFTRDGSLEVYSNFSNGKHHGTSRAVDPLDGTIRITTCDHGVVQSVKVFDKQGALTLEEFYSAGELTKSVHHTPTGIIEGHPVKSP